MRIRSTNFLAASAMLLSVACRGPETPIEETAVDMAHLEDLSPPAPPSPDLSGPKDPQPPVACGTLLPGPPLKMDSTEAIPGYLPELEALDLKSVADPYDYSGDSKLAIAVINYMLGRSQGTSVSHEAALRQGGLGRAVLGAAAKGSGGRVDFSFLRRGLYYFYPCSRPVPGSLTALRQRFGDYRTWPLSELMCSRPKDGPRRIYESPTHGVYVAETLVGDQVRETEVLFTALRTDGQIDFAAYTDTGALTDRSTFAAGSGSGITSSAPYTCISCHYDSAAGTITRRFPTGTGAGCR